MKKLEIYAVIVALFVMCVSLFLALTGPKTVEISAAQFQCTETEPHGIEARCTQYTIRAGAR